jgi:Flp pilus assembly protein TadD
VQAGLSALRRFAAPAAIVLWFAAAAAVTARGDFVNEDYEKIGRNADYLRGGPLWKKFFEPEAGYEDLYYRPLNNVLAAGIFRMSPPQPAPDPAPFRAAAALALGLAALAVYAAGLRIGLDRAAALAAAAFFAAHPFNSWAYFQGSWLGNSLVVPLMFLAWAVFEKAASAGRRAAAWIPVFAGLVYLACAAKDSGALVVPMLAPAAFRCADRRRGLAALGAGAAAALLYFIQRAFVLPPDEQARMFERIAMASGYYGALVAQYLGAILAGDTRNYARHLALFGGWPLTAAVLVLAAAAGRRLARGDARTAALAWAAAVATVEIVSSTVAGIVMASSRVTVLLALLALAGAKLVRGFEAARPALGRGWRAGRTAAAAAALLAYAFLSGRHVWASLDDARFYRYHNAEPYSWKLVGTEGLWHFHAGRLEEAVRLWRRSIAIADTAIMRNNLALALARLGRMEEAGRELRRALEEEGDDPYFHFVTGQILERTGWTGAARLHYLKAVTLDPHRSDAYEGLARCLETAGTDAWALLAFEESLGRLPEDPVLRNNLGLVFARTGELERAEEYFREAVRINPNYAKAYNNLGMAAAAQGRLEEAIGHFTRAVEIQPGYAKAIANLGAALAREGRTTEAILRLEEALLIDPLLEDARKHLEAIGPPPPGEKRP